jgi:hypothetical protein
MCTEAEARQIIGVAAAHQLVGVVEGAWDNFVAEGRPRARRTRANIVWEYMVAAADQRIARLPNVTRVEIYDTPWYVFDGRFALRMKMHSPRLFTGNVDTLHQQGIGRQDPLPGLPDGCRLSCGYTLDRAEAGIERIVITKRVRDRLEWWIDVRGLAGGELEPVAPILPGMAPEPGVVVPLPGIKATREEQTDEET